MLIADIADLHPDAVALGAAPTDAGRMGAGGRICLGDLAGTGPQPGETLEPLRLLGHPSV